MNTKTVNASSPFASPAHAAAPAGALRANATNPISSQLEGMLGVVKRLEAELDSEKKKNQRLAQEYVHARSHLENAVRQLQEQMKNRESTTAALIQEKDSTLSQVRFELAQAKAGEDRLQTLIQEISDMEKKTREELTRFQTAWGEVLGREAQARQALEDSEKNRQEIERIRGSVESMNQRLAQAKKIEDHCRAELEKAVDRILAAEEQASRLHQSLQNSEASNNRLGNEARGLRDENQKLSNHVARLIRENATLEGRVRQVEDNARRAQERYADENRARANEITKLAREEARETIEELENRANIGRLELQQVMIQAEEDRKRMSKDFLVEKLRTDSEVHNLNAVIAKLQNRIEELESRELSVEKVDGDVSGTIYVAEPVDGDSSSANRGNGANLQSAGADARV